MRGLILTGGRSVRMGQDKAEMLVDGVPQWRRIAEILRPFCHEIYWSCAAGQRERWNLGKWGLVDVFSNRGPAGGLLTAFSHSPLSPWLVTACDYPGLTGKHIAILMEARSAGADATAFENPQDHLPEPLLAVWEISAQRRLQTENSPRSALRLGTVKLIELDDAEVLRNVNTPEEWRSFREKRGLPRERGTATPETSPH